MPLFHRGLSDFLQHAKADLRRTIEEKANVTIVVGNQSADLDSFTSSLLYAYLRSRSPPRDAFTPLYIPLLNVPVADIDIRPEFATVFGHAGLRGADLITINDLPAPENLESDLKPERTRWVLVDHNKLEGKLGQIYGRRVGGLIDHHEEEHAVTFETEPEPRRLEKCGSCTSLVIDELLIKKEESGDIGVSALIDARVAKLALASILIDTNNLTSKSKTTPVDKKAAAYLERLIGRDAEARSVSTTSSTKWDRDTFFTELSKAKENIEDLPLQGILRKDYKQWTEAGMVLGMSTVVKPLKFLLGKVRQEHQGHDGNEVWDQAAESFMKERDLDIWAIMTTYTSAQGTHKRELCVQWRANSGGKEAIGRFKYSKSSEQLDLKAKEITGISTEPAHGGRVVWKQRETKMSRKQVGPLLRIAMRESSTL